MDHPPNHLDNSISEYGSDFTADEEDILNELLSRIPPTAPKTSLTSNKSEDNDYLRGARIPRKQGYEVAGFARQTSASGSEAQEIVIADKSEATIHVKSICRFCRWFKVKGNLADN